MTTSGASAAAPLRGQAARWAGQRERRRAEFVAAALEVIAKEGPGASAEAIAARAGVARTRIYRHFVDRADLERAISARVGELIVAELAPLWRPEGSARQLIDAAIGAHVRWLAANRNLYGYLVRHSRLQDSGDGGADACAHPGPADAADVDVHVTQADGYTGARRAIAEHLTGLLGGYLDLVGVDGDVAENLAYAVVGMVESVTDRWARRPADAAAGAAASGRDPGTDAGRDAGPDAGSDAGPGAGSEVGPDADVLVAQLSGWTWAMLAAVLADAGVTLDPDEPLPPLGEAGASG